MNTESGKAPVTLTDLARGNQPNKGLAGEGMGESQSRRQRVLKAAGCAALAGLVKNARGERECSWGLVAATLKSLLFPLSPPHLPPRCQAVGYFPREDWVALTPRTCCGGCCGGGGSLAARCSWEERAEAGPGVRFALHWERLNGEGCCGEGKDMSDFRGSCNISNTKMQWINEPSLEVKGLAICFGGEKS